ncbi:hypothetical protein MOZ60_02095 [Stecheria sp. CLA-KB-P133]|uniref:Transposase n=1 Tax=Grylomicrobium aquisgranensis TaxID=2926318 RepID=A0AB35U3L8_9FIRM|nr:hypothetical protein [Stecheria sp. CLA-KB-P133]
MQVVGSYGVRIRDDYDALKRTADLFSNAIADLVRPALENWKTFVKKIPRKGVRECLNA